jgi:PilZ domain
MGKPGLRRHQRMLIPSGHALAVHSNDQAPKFEGTLTVIGLGGMLIRTRNSQPYGAVLNLTIEGPLARFEAECTVRNVVGNGLGVEITKITPENDQRLRALLLRLKA